MKLFYVLLSLHLLKQYRDTVTKLNKSLSLFNNKGSQKQKRNNKTKIT